MANMTVLSVRHKYLGCETVADGVLNSSNFKIRLIPVQTKKIVRYFS